MYIMTYTHMPVILSKELILLFKEKGWSSPNEIFCAEQKEIKYVEYLVCSRHINTTDAERAGSAGRGAGGRNHELLTSAPVKE